MAFLLFNTSGVVKKITRSSQKTGQVVPNLGLAEYLIRNKSADGDLLDDPTQNYIRCKLEDPEEKRLRGIHDLMRTARERVATSKDYLERTHSAVDRSFDKLRLFTEAPSGWLRDLCTQPKELEGLTLSLEPMFTATTGQFDNDEDSADIVVQTAKPKRRADYREWAVHLPDSLSVPTEDNSTWKRKSYSNPIFKNSHQCATEGNGREARTSSAGTGNENTQEKCCYGSKTSYDEDSTWNKARSSYSYDEDCSLRKTITSYDELKEASEEKLLLQLCVDEFVIPPRLTVREIRVKDVSIPSTESKTKTCRNSPQLRETGTLSLGSDSSRARRASTIRRKSLDDQSCNGSHKHRPQPHRCVNRQCRSDCHLRRLLQQEEEDRGGVGQQQYHQHHQKQQQEEEMLQQHHQHQQKHQLETEKPQRHQQQQQHQQKNQQEKDKSQQQHHHHKQEQHHQNHQQEKEKPQQQLHHEHHQTHQQEKEKSQQRHHQHQQQQQHQSENEKSTQQQQQHHQHHSKPDQQEKEKSQHHHQQQQQQQQHHQQETEKSTQQQQHQYHQRHSKPDQQEKEKSQQQQQHQQQYHQHHEKQKQEKEKSQQQQQQQQNHHHQLQKQENEKPSHHHQLQDKKIVRVSSTASVPEQNEKRAFIKGQYIDAQTHELADFMLFIYREKEEPCVECLDSVEDSGETNDGVGKHCESSRHTHQHRTILRGTYQRKMKTTDKYIRWKFSCPVALRNE